jgi:hypothetical protein
MHRFVELPSTVRIAVAFTAALLIAVASLAITRHTGGALVADGFGWGAAPAQFNTSL